MSKAEKMFSELGYVLDESGGVFKRYTKKIIIGEVEHIYRLVFNPIDCNYGISVQIDDKEYSPYINIRTHKAIHEQMKELRWLE